MSMASAGQDDPEVEWIRRVQRGDREAYGPLVDRYQRRIFAVVYRLLRRREEVEEVAQEIFLKAYLAVTTYNFESSFGTWLMRIAVNHCYDHLRRRRSSRLTYFSEMSETGERAVLAGSESRETSGGRVERQLESRDLAGKLLERASAEDRVILTLKEIEDMSVKEIAEVLKLNAGTVKVRLHRARKRMLEDYRRWRQGR
jgi:RNA polymerase sigma-70 factor, ECF subfamily